VTYIAPATKILRYPGVLSAIQRGERVWPLHVEMDLSGVCNAHCGHCRFGDRQDGAMMAAETAYQLIDELVGGGTLAVTFSGGGEPTTNPHFAEIVTYAKHEGLKVGVYSNGILTDRLLKAAGVADWVYVSLDANNAEDYEDIKGVDGWARVCASVRALTKCGAPIPNGPVAFTERNRPILTRLLNDRLSACIVGVGMLLTGYNWPMAEAMRNVGLGLGADYVQFRPVAGLREYSWVPQALKELERIGALYSQDRFVDLYDHWRGVYKRGYTVCRASELGPTFGADGEVWVCPNTRGIRSLGNIHDETFEDIWQRRETQMVGGDCEPTCRHHQLNRTLALVCEPQEHEAFV
jgi:MoaA/NifB/PqqE/SkfB family radical SAM enzyme